MKEYKDFLKILGKGLQKAAQRLESMAEKVDSFVAESANEPVSSRGRKKTAEKEEKTATAAETILQIINQAENGINTAALINETGFDAKKVHNIVYKLKQQGKIKSKKRGVYMKA